MAGPSTPPIPRTTASDILACLDSEFSALAAAFTRGNYVLWLGSGLSRGVVPDVSLLLKNLISHLQERVELSDEDCQFSRALSEIVTIAGLPDKDRAEIDFAFDVSTWPPLEDLIARLVGQYSKVLDVVVDQEKRDYLVWDGIDVAGTYGDETLSPDAEHLCVGILILEGVVNSAPTTNWDGLVEIAVERLTDGRPNVLRVVVHQDDFLGTAARSDLIKFHGCAVRAKYDPDKYRDLLVARRKQISGWTAEPSNKITKDHLEHLVATRPALVVGLSAQDANIHTILHEARQNLQRRWPDEPPGVAFALEELGPDQTHVLEITYGEDYFPNRAEIGNATLLGGYAKPVLLGLVLFTLGDKLCSLVSGVAGLNFDSDSLETLHGDIRHLRDLSAQSGGDWRSDTERLIRTVSFILRMFRTGSAPVTSPLTYDELTAQPIPEAIADPNIPTQSLGWLGIAAALIGRGSRDGSWKLAVGDPDSPERGQLALTGADSAMSRVFVTQSASATSKLVTEGQVDMSDPSVLVVHAENQPQRSARSPRAKLGRTGKRSAREVSIEALSGEASNADDLYALFRLEAGV